MQHLVESAIGASDSNIEENVLFNEILSSAKSLDDAKIHLALYQVYGSRIVNGKFKSMIFSVLEDYIVGKTSSEVPLFWLEHIPETRGYVYLFCTNYIQWHIEDFVEEISQITQILNLLVAATYAKVPLEGSVIHLAWGLIGHFESNIAELSTKIVVLGLESAKGPIRTMDWWKGLQSKGHHPQYQYRAWLAWVRGARKDDAYYKLLESGQYWDRLMEGISLGSVSYECTKYSVRIITASINDMSKDEAVLNAWNRFVSLVEIVAIDTSMNQTQDSLSDILSLFTPGSLIPHAWVIAFLRAAMNSNMDVIKRYLSELVLSLDVESLAVFNADPKFITTVFFPYALQAHLFVVASETACPYADLVVKYIHNLFEALTEENRIIFVTTIMDEFWKARSSFEATRVVVLHAIKDKIQPILPVESLEGVVRLGEAVLRTYKTEAMAVLLHKAIVDIFLTGGNLAKINAFKGTELVQRLFSNGLATVPSMQQLVARLPDEWDEAITFNASNNPLLQAILIEKYGVPRKNNVQKGVGELVVYLKVHDKSPALFADDLTSTIITEVEALGYMSAENRTALSHVPEIWSSIPVPQLYDGLSLIDMLQYFQIKSLATETYPDVSFLIETATTKGLLRGHMSNEDRQLHAQCLALIIDMIPGDSKTWHDILPLVEQSFDHDYQPLRIAALKCLHRHLQTLDDIDDPEIYGEVMHNVWELLKNPTLRAIERSIHLEFISVVSNNISVKSNASQLEDLCVDIIKHSFARRNLLVPLVKSLSQSNELWVARVLSFAYTFLQTGVNSYAFEAYVAEKFNVYEYFWGAAEKAARVYAINFFRQAYHAEAIAKYVMTSEDVKLFQVSKRHDGEEERMRVLGYQILTIQQQFWSKDFAQNTLQKLTQAVDFESSPTARIYIEWIMALIIAKYPEWLEDQVIKPLSVDLQPRFLSSYGRIVLLIGKSVDTGLSRQIYARFLEVLIPLCSSNRAPIRHFSVALVYVISLSPKLQLQLEDEAIKLVKGIALVAESVENYKDFKSGDEVVWDIQEELTLAGVCGGIASRVTDRVTGDYLTCADFEAFLGPGDYGNGWVPAPDRAFSTFHNITVIRDSIKTTSDNIQTKSGSVDDPEDFVRSELIVVASLCDKPPNMGGICRLSEALGAKLLTFHDLSLVSHPQFRNTSMTADKWMPMKQVTEAGLPDFLMEQKRQGYTLVGLEQTDNSRKLTPEVKFPKKTLLLMGKEREGIPGELLGLLDFCVEIEQRGVVRSLNIQTATAVLVHAYNHQHVN